MINLLQIVLSDIPNKQIIYQTLWIVAFLLHFSSHSFKNDTYMFAIGILASIFWVAHFSIISATTGAVLSFIAIFRNIVSIHFKWNKKIIYIFLLIYWIVGYVTYDNIYSLFPVFSACVYIISYMLFSWIKLRIAILIGTIWWAVYYIYTFSIWGMISEVFIITTIFITIFRLKKSEISNLPKIQRANP